MSVSYKDAGVDIVAGEKLVDMIKPMVKSTHNDKVLSNIGLFGGFFRAEFDDCKKPILVGSTDGVGTKLKIAFSTNRHDTIGQCLVNHCVNDILCCGARPLFFLDYFATGKLNPETAAEVISGFAKACKENGTALIGGETAEMPSMYNEGEYDVSGTIVGVVDETKVVNGEKIQPNDILIGLKATGLHTNGYSLARKVLLEKYNVDDFVDELGTTIGESLLAVHKSYLNTVHPLVIDELLTGISHITGGGIIGNTKRILPKDCKLNIHWDSWEELPIFKLIRKTGNITEEEMRNAFNLGIGMILVVRPENLEVVMNRVKDDSPIIIGKIEKV